MVFNFTKKHQFATRLKIDDNILETVTQTKLLGTIVTNDLKWDENTNHIVKKAYARMEMLRRLSGFQAPQSDLKHVYIVYIRSLLEQSCNVWHSSLTLQNKNDLERVQKVAVKLILKDKYQDYQTALNILDLETLKDRREELCLKFAQKCLKNPKMKHLFPNNENTQETRKHEHFKVLFAKTSRLKDSPIIYMQNILNKEVLRKKDLNNIWNV